MELAIQQVPYVNISAQFGPLRDEIMAAVEEVLSSGMYILGDPVRELECSMAGLCGTKYAVGLNSGTDALILVMQALGIGKGDEVIVPPNSFLASASSVAIVGARPVFADVAEDYNLDPTKLEAAITSKTKAIVPVHLTGRPAPIDEINAIAQKHGLYVLEDAAQAVGAAYKGRKVGSLGLAAGFSMHPLKNLNAAGDAGFVTTDDAGVYEYLLKARNHGLRDRDNCEFWSLNSRIDTVQAAILNVKLNYLEQWNDRRRAIATHYQSRIGNVVRVPQDKEHEHAVYHTFIIQAERRDELQAYLSKCGVGSKVHYPIPIHMQEAAAGLGYKKGDFPVTEKQVEHILSLPVYPELTDDQVEYICTCILNFYQN